MQKLMKVRCLTLVLCFFACSMQMVLAQLPLRNANNAGIGSSQGMEDEQEKANRTTWGRDTTEVLMTAPLAAAFFFPIFQIISATFCRF